MEQTAVEWLEKQLTLALNDEVKDLRGLFVVAKEIDKKEKRYSEEEVKKLIVDFLFIKGIGREVGSVKEWFEQFKK